MTTSLTQYFSSTDYLLSLPMLLLALFALGILLIDLLLPKQWKRVNAFTALVGLAFSAAAVGKLHYAYHVAQQRGLGFVDTAFLRSLRVDPPDLRPQGINPAQKQVSVSRTSATAWY